MRGGPISIVPTGIPSVRRATARAARARAGRRGWPRPSSSRCRARPAGPPASSGDSVRPRAAGRWSASSATAAGRSRRSAAVTWPCRICLGHLARPPAGWAARAAAPAPTRSGAPPPGRRDPVRTYGASTGTAAAEVTVMYVASARPAAGADTGTTTAPRSRSASTTASRRASTPTWLRAPRSSSSTPTRSPRTSRRRRPRPAGAGAPTTPSSSADVRRRCAPADPPGRGPGANGTHAAHRHHPRRGRHADDAALRRGLADRAAGVGADATAAPRAPRQPPPTRRCCRRGCAAGRAGCGCGRTPTSGWRPPSRARPCSRGRARRAPAGAAGGSRRASTARGVARAPSSPLVVTWPRTSMLSLTTTGTPARAPGREPAARRTSVRCGLRRARLGVDVHQRARPRLGLGDPVQVRLATSTAVTCPVAHELGDPGRRQVGQRPADRRHDRATPPGRRYDGVLMRKA